MMRRWLVLIALLLALGGCNLTGAPPVTPSPTATITVVPSTATSYATPLPASTSTDEVPLITILPLDDETRTPTLGSTLPITGADIPFPTTYINSYGITAREGQTIYINYDVTVDNPGRGRVFILVLDPTGVEAGRYVVTDTRADTLEIEAKVSGDYMAYITPENLSGNYTSSYGTR